MISAMTAKKLLRKGCTWYLSYTLNFDKNEIKLVDISIVKEFFDVLPEEPP
jgi:hypothetical protein